jgi:ATP-binding cassette, subfamily C, bacterial
MDKVEFRPLRQSLPALFSYFIKRYPARTGLVAFCLLVSGVVEGFSIALMLPLLDLIMAGSEAQSGVSLLLCSGLKRIGLEPGLTQLLLLIVAGISLKSAIRWYAMNQVGYSVAKVATDLRNELSAALMDARWSHFVNAPSGYYTHALGMEAKIASSAYRNMISAIACLVQLVIYLLVALLTAWETALLACATGVVLLIALRRFVATSQRAGHGQITSMKILTGRLSDALNAFKSIKAMRGEKRLHKILVKETETVNEALRMKVLAGETLTAFQEPIMVAVMAGGLVFAIQWLGMEFSLLMLQVFLFQRLVFQGNMLQRTVQSIAAEESALWSIRAGIDSAHQAVEADTSRLATPVLEQAITLEDLSFSYGDRKVLDNASMTVPAGSFTLLVGPSGAGKTTILDLLAGLVMPESGDVKVDGRSLRELNMQDWRKGVGYVVQEMGLLHDSVLNNVTLGDPAISREDAEDALKRADIWDHVTSLEEGIDTMVGERGSKMSGGQRQRVALARALARKPRLLLLDEITASLDPASEEAICRTLAGVAGSMTVVAISHQQQLRDTADQVVRMEKGVLVVESEGGVTS